MNNNSSSIVITGCSSGIGEFLSHKLSSDGHNIIGLSRNKPNFNINFIQCDIKDFNAVKNTFKRLKNDKIAVLINAAGVASMNLAVTTPYETMNNIIMTNLLGSMYTTAECARLMIRQKWGRIINFSTIAVELGLAGEATYVASKAGVEAYTRTIARELSNFNITANCIAPGPIDTRLISHVPEEKIQKIIDRQIIQKKCLMDDVYKLIKWLLSDESASISGQVLHINGV